MKSLFALTMSKGSIVMIVAGVVIAAALGYLLWRMLFWGIDRPPKASRPKFSDYTPSSKNKRK